ncbi:hypothetical protein V6N13_040857 [Hibiscus sabdariffa]
MAIVISDLPHDVRDRELWSLLNGLVGYKSFQIDHTEENPVCVARFSTSQQASNAVSFLNGKVLDYQKKTPLHVEIYNDPEETEIKRLKTSYFRDMSSPRCTFFGEKLTYGHLHVHGGSYIETRYIKYQSEDEANLINRLLNDGSVKKLLKSFRLLQIENDWVIAVEKALPVVDHFSKMKDNWIGQQPKARTRKQRQVQSQSPQSKKSWFKFIQNDFEVIFRATAKIWSKFLDDQNYTSRYTSSPEHCLWVSAEGGRKKVMILPGVVVNSSNDIDELRTFMFRLISLPFGGNDDYNTIMNCYDLSDDLRSFLRYLNGINLVHVGPKFLLRSHPFSFFDYEKSRFIVNLDEMMKRRDIDGPTLISYVYQVLSHGRDWTKPRSFTDGDLEKMSISRF